jgi:hypothetical protein
LAKAVLKNEAALSLMSAQELTFRIGVDPAVAVAAMRSLTQEAKTSTASIEASVRQEAQAAVALQRQRSAAIVAQWKADTREADNAAKAQAAAVLKGAAQAAAGQIQLAHSAAAAHHLTADAVKELSDHLNLFVGERLPLFGGAFVRISENLRNLHISLKPVEGSILTLGKAIGELSSKSGKSVDDVKTFLESYAKLETQSVKDTSAIQFFGAALAQDLSPQLNRASTEMGVLAAAGGEAGSGIAAIAAPIAIAVVAVAALIAVEYELIKTGFEASEQFANFGGELGRAADQTKLTVEQLNGLKLLADENHISFEGLTLALGKYLRAVVQAQQEGPTSQLAQQFERLGIDVTKLGDDPVKSINALLEAFDRLGPSMKENQAAQALLSREGIRMITIFRETGGSLDELTKRGQQYRQVTAGDVEIAKQQERASADLATAWQNLTLQYGKTVSPEVSAFLKELTVGIGENKEAVLGLFNAASWLITGTTVKELFKNIGDGVHFVNDLAKAWNTLAGEIKDAGNAAVAYAAGAGSGAWAMDAPARSPETKLQTAATFGSPGAASKQEPLATTEELGALQQLKNAYEATKISVTSAISDIARAQKAGHTSEAEATAETIAHYKQLKDAGDAYYESALAQKHKDLDLAASDVVSQRKIQGEINTLENEQRKQQEDARKSIADARASQREQEYQSTVAHLERMLAIELDSSKARVDSAKALAALHLKTQSEANRVEETEEKKQLEIRGNLLGRELKLLEDSGDTQSQKHKEIKDKIAALENEKTQIVGAQASRRQQISEAEAEERLRVVERQSQQELSVQSAADETAILRLNVAAAVRTQTEEAAAQAILTIRLAAIARELKALEDQGKAVDKLIDPKKQKEARDALVTQEKVLFEKRTQIQLQGNEDLDGARRADIAHFVAYREALGKLQVDGLQVDQGMARLRIDLLKATHASGLLILQAELAEAKAAEDRRHAQELLRLRNEYDAAVKAAATMRQKLEALKAYNAAVEAENKRHAASASVIDPNPLIGASVNRAELIFGTQLVDVFQKIRNAVHAAGAEMSAFKLATLAVSKTAADFFHQQSKQAGDFASIMQSASVSVVQGLADIGVQWILTGHTGEAALRKLVAQTLAAIFQQAVMKAAWEAAEALAEYAIGVSLASNPFTAILAPPHFVAASAHGTAALAYAALAGGAAIGGRLAAGNAFNQSTGGAASGSASGRSGSSGGSGSSSGEIKPTDVNRRAVASPTPTTMTINLGLKDGIVAEHFKRDYNMNGVTRLIIQTDGQG